jgi:murein DD-endopeptidase MepM/ murein hydrolase activator NlpD
MAPSYNGIPQIEASMVFRINLTFALVFSVFALLLNVAIAAPTGAVAVDALYKLQLEPPVPKQGQPLVVRLSIPDGAPEPSVKFNKKSYRMFPVQTNSGGTVEYRAIIGVPADLKPGTYKMTIGEIEHSLKVSSGAFGIQRIRLPRSKDNFISSPGEEEAVQAAKDTVTPEQLWTGKFKRPSLARTSSQFGLRRMVNGRLLTDYFHSGLDFAGGLGSPVAATQDGRVIIAKTGWRLHGNTVAINHGQGVVSFYIHLSKILVKPGEMVKAGQQIGKIGATGRASGPHLHFSIYTNGNATSPLDWFSRNI